MGISVFLSYMCVWLRFYAGVVKKKPRGVGRPRGGDLLLPEFPQDFGESALSVFIDDILHSFAFII